MRFATHRRDQMKSHSTIEVYVRTEMVFFPTRIISTSAASPLISNHRFHTDSFYHINLLSKWLGAIDENSYNSKLSNPYFCLRRIYWIFFCRNNDQLTNSLIATLFKVQVSSIKCLSLSISNYTIVYRPWEPYISPILLMAMTTHFSQRRRRKTKLN